MQKMYRHQTKQGSDFDAPKVGLLIKWPTWGQVTAWEVYLFIFVRFIADKLARLLTLGRIFSTHHRLLVTFGQKHSFYLKKMSVERIFGLNFEERFWTIANNTNNNNTITNFEQYKLSWAGVLAWTFQYQGRMPESHFFNQLERYSACKIEFRKWLHQH